LIRIILILIFTTLTANPLFSQQNSSILEDAIRYRGLTPEDITIPINFSDTTATNNSRLLLPIVERMMKNPLQYDGWVDSVGGMTGMDIDEIFYFIFQQNGYYQPWGESRTSFQIIIDHGTDGPKTEDLVKGLMKLVKEEYEFQFSILS